MRLKVEKKEIRMAYRVYHIDVAQCKEALQRIKDTRERKRE